MKPILTIGELEFHFVRCHEIEVNSPLGFDTASLSTGKLNRAALQLSRPLQPKKIKVVPQGMHLKYSKFVPMDF